MGWVIFIAFCVSSYLVWRFVSKNLKSNGSSQSAINFSSSFIAVVLAFGQAMLMNSDSVVANLFGWLLFGLIVMALRSPSATEANIEPSISIPFKLSPIAEAAYSTASPDDDPLAKWRAAGPSTSATIADIEFDYRDARGKDSHRHVYVEAVDQEYFQGFCFKASDTRTFVIGRVKGKVIDVDTGELLSAKALAAKARQHPDNDPEKIEIGRDSYWDEDPPAEDMEHAEIEICFTGFVKADKLRLEGMAELADMKVRQSVTKGLTHLCTGPNAGPAKISQAMEVGAELIDQSEFFELADRS